MNDELLDLYESMAMALDVVIKYIADKDLMVDMLKMMSEEDQRHIQVEYLTARRLLKLRRQRLS